MCIYNFYNFTESWTRWTLTGNRWQIKRGCSPNNRAQIKTTQTSTQTGIDSDCNSLNTYKSIYPPFPLIRGSLRRLPNDPEVGGVSGDRRSCDFFSPHKSGAASRACVPSGRSAAASNETPLRQERGAEEETGSVNQSQTAELVIAIAASGGGGKEGVGVGLYPAYIPAALYRGREQVLLSVWMLPAEIAWWRTDLLRGRGVQPSTASLSLRPYI